MGDIKHDEVLDYTNRVIIDLDYLRQNPALQKEVNKLDLRCLCGNDCQVKMQLVSINSKRKPYFTPLYRDAEHTGGGEKGTHKYLKNMIMDKWGAELPDIDQGIWKDEPRPDGVMESEKIVIEIEGFRHRNWKNVIERNKVYREKGYTPFWIIYGRNWADFADKSIEGEKKLKTFSISNLTSLEAGIYADCGFLHYYIGGRNARQFITHAIFKGGELCITHPNNSFVKNKPDWNKLYDSNSIKIKPKIVGRWKNGYDVCKKFNDEKTIRYGGLF